MILASDFDKTLYFYDRKEKISQEDRESIAFFQKKGNLFGLSTGRTYYGIKAVLEEEIPFDFYILSTGSVILDKDGNTLFEKKFDEDIPQTVHQEYQGKMQMIFHGDRTAFSFSPFSNTLQAKITSLEEVKGGVHSMSFAFQTEEEAKEFASDLEKRFPLRIQAFQNINFVDAVPNGCSKGEGLRFIQKLYHEKTSAIGDSFNDLPILEEADFSFTFPYAPKIVQEKATHVVSSVSEAIKILLYENN